MQISYKKKITKNLGNYESIALEIGIDDVVDHEVETWEEAFIRVRGMVNAKLKVELLKVGGM